LSNGPRPLTVEDLIILNQRAVLIGGGKSGVRDRARLEYAVDRPFWVLNGQQQYPTHHSKAAALMEIIIWNQAFVDGNKRTGQRAGAALLRVLSGRRLYVPTQEGIQVCLAVERRDMDTAALASWLYKRSALNNPARPL
jgi:prophage maintenance system killer protein